MSKSLSFIKKVLHFLIPVLILFILRHSIFTAVVSLVYFLVVVYVYVFIKKIDMNNDGIFVAGILIDLFLITFYVEGV